MENGKYDYTDKLPKNADECGPGTSGLNPSQQVGLLDYKPGMLLPDLKLFDFNNEEKINNGICSKAEAEDNSFSIMDLKPDIEENKLAIKNSKEKVKVDLSSFDSFLSLTFPCSSIYEGVPNLNSISDLDLSLPSDDDDESFDFGEMENITKGFLKKMREMKLKNSPVLHLLNENKLLKKKNQELSQKLESLKEYKQKDLWRVGEYQELKMQYNLATKHRDRLLKDCYTLQNDLNSLTKRMKEMNEENWKLRLEIDSLLKSNDQRVEKQEWLKAKNSFASVYNGNKNNLNALEGEKKFEKVRLTNYNDFSSQKKPKGRNHIYRGAVLVTNRKNFSPTYSDDGDDDLEIDCRASM